MNGEKSSLFVFLEFTMSWFWDWLYIGQCGAFQMKYRCLFSKDYSRKLVFALIQASWQSKVEVATEISMSSNQIEVNLYVLHHRHWFTVSNDVVLDLLGIEPGWQSDGQELLPMHHLWKSMTSLSINKIVLFCENIH